MSHALPQPLTDLSRDATLRIADGRPHVVDVFEGQIWLTQDGDERDIFLEGGDSFSVSGAGLTLVQALRDTRLLVSERASFERTFDAQALHREARALRDAAVAALIVRAAVAVESVLLGLARRAFVFRGPRTQLLRAH
jgi:hypothetical protein